MLARDQVTLGILAGGQARRMGGVDKALLTYHGTSLLSRTLTALVGLREAIDAAISPVRSPAWNRCLPPLEANGC